MKKLFLLALLCPTFLLAQKVKIKKDNVLIDKVLVGTIVKTKDSLKNKLFTYSDIEGNPLIIYKYEVVNSPIEGDEEVYAFNEVTIPSLDITAGLDLRTENAQVRKKVVSYFMEKGVVNKDGSLNTDVAQSVYGSMAAIPLEIQEMLDQEMKEMEPLDFIEDRDMSQKVYVSFTKTEKKSIPYVNMISITPFIIEHYDIKQGTKVIGQMRARYRQALTAQPGKAPGKTGDPIVFFYNNKGARIATAELGMTKLRVHRYKWNLGRIEHRWLQEENRSALYREIVGYLVDKKAL